MPSTIVKIAVQNVQYHFDKTYDYLIPPSLEGQVQAGVRVMVPFGNGNRKRQGLVMEVVSESEVRRIKPITAVLDKAPLLNADMLKLVRYLKERTFCTYFEAAKSLLPGGINMRMVASYSLAPEIGEANLEKLPDSEKLVCTYLLKSGAVVERERLLEIMELPPDSPMLEKLVKQGYLVRTDDAIRRAQDATLKMARLTGSRDETEAELPNLTKKQAAVIALLLEMGSVSYKEIQYFTGVTQAVITALIKRGLVESYSHAVYRKPYQQIPRGIPAEKTVLTQEQQAVCDALSRRQSTAEKGAVSLLYGITGSGKTQVFLHLIDRVLAQGKNVIVMVPEIALTSQTLQIFFTRYGEGVAVIHSALSVGERMDEWKRIQGGGVRIVVGTRSAVLAPLPEIGLIIMDEEQEHTYKSEASPRYHARDVAIFRCAEHNALLLLASATPSVESYTYARKGIYGLHKLQNRYGGATLPCVITVDLNEDLAQGNKGQISNRLAMELKQNLTDHKQSILLINRRGYNTFVSCRACKHVLSCPNCSISLTYHHSNGRLMCHYCGYSTPMTETCPHCGEKKIRYAGFGTQKLEEELLELFPGIRILRMDTDTTMSRYAHEEKFTEFGAGHYDVMIGTQMVAKGLDFENVTLVGVICADQALYGDDFRSSETAFSLLTQVVGRSGRGQHAGRAIIQTFTPENPIIHLAAEQNYDAFYESEILTRKFATYPPFCDICMVGFTGVQEDKVKKASEFFFAALKIMNTGDFRDQKIIVLGPAAATIAKIGQKYRYRMVIKCHNNSRFRAMIANLLTDFEKEKEFSEIQCFADMNPSGII